MKELKKPEPFGAYILLEKLAMGGMAEIFLSRSSGAHGIGKFVAIKRILPQYSSNTDFINMFTEEAKLCMNLSHSNIAKIHEFGIENSQFYIAMELISGRNLRQILSRLGKESRPGLSVDQATFIAKEIASGLDYAHRCLDNSNGKPLNIIHRDMSPQNVMISYDGEVKVVDFGIAKTDKEDEGTKAGTIKGKFSYMSPEQASGERLDIRTDVFSLGIVLWEVLANKRLFTASTEMTTLKKIRECKVPPISKINPKVPEELERIVNIALAKNPDNRYQTCAEFYKDLNRFLNRFYPDFSAHDFSVFIKSLYADEVLENRDKFIEFSKISLDYKNQKDQEENDETMISFDKSSNIFGDKIESSVSLDLKNMTLGSNTHPLNRYGGRERSSQHNNRVTTVQKKKKDFLTVANLSVIALFFIAIGLVVSQLVPSKKSTDYSLQQPSVVQKAMDSLNTHGIVITSNPSAAEIYIDGKNIGQLTPARVKVPASKEFTIGLKKDGYLSRKITHMSRGNGSKEEFNLEKIATGYLNIYTKNTRDTVIYINDKKLNERTPIKSYRVPAGVSLRVKAIDVRRNKILEKKVSVKADESLTLKLNPTRSL